MGVMGAVGAVGVWNRCRRGVAVALLLAPLSQCGKEAPAPKDKSRQPSAAVKPPAMEPARVTPRPVVRPRARPAARKAPPFKDVEVTFKSKDFTLHGTLSVPIRPQGTRMPAYLLVHGSGPQSRKVKAAGVEIFTELAKALVARGAVVLRYDKRTFTMRTKALAIKDRAKQKAYLARFKDMVPDDFIADARVAFDFLAARPEVDPKDITVVGHSQGGSFAPDIVRGKPAARVVLLAPGMQRFDQMLVDQLEHQRKILEKVPGAEGVVYKTVELLKMTRKMVQMIRDPKVPPSQKLMGASKKFYLRSNELTKDMVGKIRALRIPTLIIQGDKDLKCIPAVLLKAKPMLEKNPHVRVKMVKHMTHELLVSGLIIFEEDVPKLIWAHRQAR